VCGGFAAEHHADRRYQWIVAGAGGPAAAVLTANASCVAFTADEKAEHRLIVFRVRFILSGIATVDLEVLLLRSYITQAAQCGRECIFSIKSVFLQCIDTVGWPSGRASGL